MKILIVDDNLKKAGQVIDYFTEHCDVSRDDIEHVPTALSAKRLLAQTQFDLVILDISLPLRENTDPACENSLELLDAISSLDTLKKPGYIVGFTAFEELKPQFENKLWKVLKYSDTEDNWKTHLRSLLDYILSRSKEKPNVEYGCDLCVITALPSEMEQVYQLPWNWNEHQALDDTAYVRYGSFCVDQKEYSVCTAFSPRMGMVSAALLTAKLINTIRPKLIVMTGICAGVRGKASLGDIILADPSWDWQNGKRISDKDIPSFAISPHQLPVAEQIRTMGQMLRLDIESLRAIKDKYAGAKPSHDLNLHVAPMASGSAVLADESVVNEIKLQERNLTGVEMEVYGVYAAVANAGHPRPKVVAFKSVCDFADSEKNDQYQHYAAYTSAQFMKLFLDKNIDRIISA